MFEVRNRSHFVTSQSHEQFRKLDTWLETRKTCLWQALMSNTRFPGRYILFGEWLAAKHSVFYSRLPDLFLAFDLFDRLKRRFVCRKRLESLLVSTSIKLVRNLNLSVRPLTVENLVTKLQGGIQSAYGDEMVEGFYLRSEDSQWLQNRVKIVRADFIVGDAHWSKGMTVWNRVVEKEVIA